MRAPYLALHLTNTLLLLAALTLTAHLLSRSKGYMRGRFAWLRPSAQSRSRRCDDRRRHRLTGRAGRHALSGHFTGLRTGSGFLSATSGWLVRWRWTHPTVAVLASVFLIWILVRAAQTIDALEQSRASPRWCWCCWPRNMCWGFSTWCCSRRCGCRSRTCWAPMCCGLRWWC